MMEDEPRRTSISANGSIPIFQRQPVFIDSAQARRKRDKRSGIKPSGWANELTRSLRLREENTPELCISTLLVKKASVIDSGGRRFGCGPKQAPAQDMTTCLDQRKRKENRFVLDSKPDVEEDG